MPDQPGSAPSKRPSANEVLALFESPYFSGSWPPGSKYGRVLHAGLRVLARVERYEQPGTRGLGAHAREILETCLWAMGSKHGNCDDCKGLASLLADVAAIADPTDPERG